MEIEKKQEEQRIRLAHGGFADLVDFEKAIKEGAGADYHDVHGYPGMMGAPPTKKAADGGEKEKKPVAAPPAGQCGPVGGAPGAEPPVECTPPGVEGEAERPKDEL